MSKTIRKILEKYADYIVIATKFGTDDLKVIDVEDFDKLEKELQELFDSAKNRKKRFNKVDDVIGII